MAEIKNNFLSSKMNKDLDDRLIQNGEYRDALNIQIGKSENNDIGVIQPISGNSIPAGYPIETDETVKCIGMFMDEQNNRIFQFLTNYTDPDVLNITPAPYNATMKITMFDVSTQTHYTLVSGSFLDFATNPEFSITGVNLLEDLLFWTDNRNQPRKINIRFAKDDPNYYTSEWQISVAKYAPVETISMYRKIKKIITSDNIGNEVFLSDVSGITKGMQLIASSVDGLDYAIVTEIGTGSIMLYNDLPNGTLEEGQEVFFMASTMSDKSEVENWPGDPDFLQDKYVRFSYRYRFDDGEYSIIAPFTQIAYIPNQKGYFIDTNETDAYRSTVVRWFENNINNIELLIPFPDKLNTVSSSYKITEFDVLYKESDSAVIKVLETIKVSSIVDNNTNIYNFPYQSQKPYKTLTEDQTVRVSDRVPVRARAQESASNRIIYGNYRDRYYFENPINYNTLVKPKSDAFSNFIEYPNHTLKQNRTYQVGFILSDKGGRQSSVILSSVDLSTVNNNDNIFGGSTVYAPFVPQDDILFPGVKGWFGNALSVLVNTPLISNRSMVLGQSGLYANETSPFGFAIGSSTINGNEYTFSLYGAPWTSNTVVPQPGQYLRGKYKDYVKVLQVDYDDPNYIVITDGDVNDLYEYNPEFAGVVPDIKFAYTINEIGWYSYKVVVRQQEQDYYNVYLPGLLNGYPVSQTYGSQITYSNADGVELATTADSVPTGWSGSGFATGYTHSSGTTAPLLANIPPVPGSYYNIVYTITGATATDNLSISFGGVDLDNLYQTGATYIKATTTDTLVITPDSAWAGTISLSIKLANASLATNENGINTTSFPVGENNRTAHAVLINDNINKIPRDLSEVGPDQKQYRSSVALFGRVQNVSIDKGELIGDEPPYDSLTDTITYTIADQGTSLAYLNAKPGDNIYCVEAAADIPGTPPLPNPNKWYANTVIVSNTNDGITGEIKFTPANNILKILPTGSYVTFKIRGASNQQYFPTTRADIATSIANALDFNFLENSLENVSGSAGLNFYQLQTNPIIARISTKDGIGVLAEDSMIPFLAVYETRPQESLLDIFWETSTVGYISDLNWDVNTGFDGPVTITDPAFEFYEDQHDGGDDKTGDPNSPYITDVFTTLDNLDNIVTDTTATMTVINDSSNLNVSQYFVLETEADGLPAGHYRIKIATDNTGAPIYPFVFNHDANTEESYTFTISFLYTLPGTTNVYTFPVIINGKLGNARPIITQGSTIPVTITEDATAVISLTGTNGAYSSPENTSELRWEITGGNEDGKFIIDPLTGVLSRTQNTQVEDYDTYLIDIRLIDATLPSGVSLGNITTSARSYESLATEATVEINVLPASVNSRIRPYITPYNFIYNQQSNDDCTILVTPTAGKKYGMVYVGREPLLNGTWNSIGGNPVAVNQLPDYPGSNRQFQNFVNIETETMLQNGETGPTEGFTSGTLRWTVVLGGITETGQGIRQKATLNIKLYTRQASVTSPNPNAWAENIDDNNVIGTGTINNNFANRGGYVPIPSLQALNIYGANYLTIELDPADEETGFRMTSFTTKSPGPGWEYAVGLELIDESTGCTAPLGSVGANAMVYVHDANYYYDGTWDYTGTTPLIPPKFVFDSPIVPILNEAVEYNTGLEEPSDDTTRGVPYLNSIPFHLQDNRTQLEYKSKTYKITSVTTDLIDPTIQTITFGADPTYTISTTQYTQQFAAPSTNPNMSEGIRIKRVGASGTPEDSSEVGYINALEADPINAGSYLTNTFTIKLNSALAPLNVDDIILMQSRSPIDKGAVYARTKFGNSIKQLYFDEACTQKWIPPVPGKFYNFKTTISQNIQEVAERSLILGWVSNMPLYCAKINETGRVIPIDFNDATNKFSVQTCWEAGLFTDLPSTYINVTYPYGNTTRSYQGVWSTQNLNVTEYRNGDPILLKETNSDWDNSATEGARCFYDNNPSYGNIYGQLYNWAAVNDPRKIAPYGWTVAEFAYQWGSIREAAWKLFNTTNINNTGQIVKQPGTLYWSSNSNPTSTNRFNLNLAPGGLRRSDGTFWNANETSPKSGVGYWWTDDSTLPSVLTVGFVYIGDAVGEDGDTQNTFRAMIKSKNDNRRRGMSVRLTKENPQTPGVYGRPLIQYLGEWNYQEVLANG